MAEPEMMKREEYEELVLSLPKAKNWAGTFLYQYQGIRCEPVYFQSLLHFHKHFEAQDSDIVVATFPKSGTTWLKSLTYSITYRALHSPLMTNSPLLSANSHTLVPFVELQFGKPLDDLPTPRVLSTHVPSKLLPASMRESKCRIIYVCRNPLDQFISHYFHYQNFPKPDGEDVPKVELKEAFDSFCEGVQMMGPMWDHVLGYWEMSRERPDKVLFLRYEDMKQDTAGCAKRVAEFLGCPFSEEEEARGVVQDVVKLCSFDTLKGLDVNKTGEWFPGRKNKNFFRKGEVGDWANYLSPDMVQRVQSIFEEKLQGSGLTFEFELNKQA